MSQPLQQKAHPLLNLEGLSDTERRILLGALHCFTHKGYFNTNIPDIVTASGVSTGSIYHHFKDKATLAEQLIERLINGIDQAMSDVVSSQAEPLQQIEAVIGWMLHLADHYPRLISFILYARHREFLPHLPPICMQMPFQHMRSLAVAARDSNQLPRLDESVLGAVIFGPTLRIVQAAVEDALPHPASCYKTELIRALHALKPASQLSSITYQESCHDDSATTLA